MAAAQKAHRSDEVQTEPAIFRTLKWVVFFFGFYFTNSLMHSKEAPLAAHAGLLRLHTAYQALLFLLLASSPAYVTGVMWWVDLAWPVGLCFMSAYVFTHFEEGWALRKGVVCSLLFLHGLRMAAGACYAILSGTWRTDKDLPRY